MPNKMSEKEIAYRITTHIARVSGLDQHREYLGISKISQCPRAAVLEFKNGITETGEAHRMCYAGYEQERAVMQGGHVNSDAMEKIGESFVRDLRIRAEMVVHIGDAWYVEADDRQEGVSPSEHPNRKHAVTFNGIMREGRGVVGFLPYDVTDDGRLALVMDDAQEPVKLVEVTTSEAQYVGDDRYKLYDRLVSAFLAGVEQAEGGAIVGGLLE